MKNIVVTFVLCLLPFAAFSQFKLKGSVAVTGSHSYLYLYKIIKAGGSDLLVDSIIISPLKTFSYILKKSKNGELYKLVSCKETDLLEFPENAFVFPVEHKGILCISAVTIYELYNARVLKGSGSAKIISTNILAPLSVYFKIAGKIKTETSKNDRDDLFKKMDVFQKDYTSALQNNITCSKRIGVLVAGLYFLAKMEEACGEGDFGFYYNMVKAMLPATSLTNDLRKIFLRD